MKKFKQYLNSLVFSQDQLNSDLVSASASGDFKKVKQSVNGGANVHADDDWALISSAMNGHLNIVKYLINNYADIDAQDGSPLLMALYKRQNDAAKLLISLGAKLNLSKYKNNDLTIEDIINTISNDEYLTNWFISNYPQYYRYIKLSNNVDFKNKYSNLVLGSKFGMFKDET